MKTKTSLFDQPKRFAPLLFLLLVLFTNPHAAIAQKAADSSKLLKYELSIDLVPLIDNGQFGKIYFKINHFKDKKLKGAFRIGAAEGTYWFVKYLPNTVVTTSADTYNDFAAEVFLGYEKYKTIGRFLTYYGLDLSGRYFIREYDPHYNGDYWTYSIGLCPFVGIKQHISKKLSMAFEIGWDNHFDYAKELHPDSNGLTNTSFRSDLRLPYNFTFNYHF